MSNKMLGKRIAKLRNQRGLTQTQLAHRIGMSHSTIASWETGTRDPHSTMIVKLGDFFDVSVDYLLGRSLSAIVEDRLTELGISIEDLAVRTKIPLARLQKMDQWDPFTPDFEQDGVIDRLARALDLDFDKLASAYARQEPPGYDGPRSSIEEDFADEDFSVSPSGEKSFDPQLTPRDERDIAKDLDRIMADLESGEGLAFYGEELELDDEAKELLRASMEQTMRLAKMAAKNKFTPKKYRSKE